MNAQCPSLSAADDPLAWLQALPAAAARNDPPRWRVLQGLARRAAAQPPGPLRQLLVQRLQARWAAWPAQPSVQPQAPIQPAPAVGPWRELLQRLPPADAELRALALHRRSFTRLRTARQLAPLQTPPAQAVGPLNTLALLPRALLLLQATSPEYLQRLLAQVEGLAAMAAAGSAALPPAAALPGKPAKGGKPARASRR